MNTRYFIQRGTLGADRDGRLSTVWTDLAGYNGIHDEGHRRIEYCYHWIRNSKEEWGSNIRIVKREEIVTTKETAIE